jgi:hypothetical protein
MNNCKFTVHPVKTVPFTLFVTLMLACQPDRGTSAETEKASSPASAPMAADTTQLRDTVRYESQPGSLVQIDGTSTIHDWTVKGGIIKGFIEADAGFPESAAKPGTVKPKVEVTIPVRTLKSQVAHLPKTMDEVMQGHMNMAHYPNIEYRLLDLAPKTNAGLGVAFQFDAKGALTVSGVTRTNVMPVTIVRTNRTQVIVVGSTTLKMTDFSVEPPAPSILGMPVIKTGDGVKISIAWLTPQKIEPAPPSKTEPIK